MNSNGLVRTSNVLIAKLWRRVQNKIQFTPFDCALYILNASVTADEKSLQILCVHSTFCFFSVAITYSTIDQGSIYHQKEVVPQDISIRRKFLLCAVLTFYTRLF